MRLRQHQDHVHECARSQIWWPPRMHTFLYKCARTYAQVYSILMLLLPAAPSKLHRHKKSSKRFCTTPTRLTCTRVTAKAAMLSPWQPSSNMRNWRGTSGTGSRSCGGRRPTSPLHAVFLRRRLRLRTRDWVLDPIRCALLIRSSKERAQQERNVSSACLEGQ